MKYIEISKSKSIKGKISIQSAKNSILLLIICSLLTNEKITIKNVSDITDLNHMLNLLKDCGIKLSFEDSDIDTFNLIMSKSDFNIKTSVFEDQFHLNSDVDKELKVEINNFFSEDDQSNLIIFNDDAKKVRTSLLFLGSLLGSGKNIVIRQPGGCSLGTRNFDMHIDALTKMGASIKNILIESKGYIFAKIPNNQINLDSQNGIIRKKLNAIEYTFRQISVTGTANIIFAAVLAKGTTILHNIAIEPELIDLISILNSMSAKIKFIDERSISIEGVDKLLGTDHEAIKDRIEAGTYMIAGAILGENLRIDISPLLVKSTTEVLRKIGAEIQEFDDYLIINKAKQLDPICVITEPYPGFSTDLQPQLTAILTIVNGKSEIIETMFDNRFCHIPELKKMNADIEVIDRSICINGVRSLTGRDVNSYALRGSAAMVIAGMIADEDTKIYGLENLYRGYSNIVAKLRNCGIDIYEKFDDV